MRISRWWGPVGVALLTQLLSLAAAGRQQPKKYPWEKEPGPIAGRWKVTCARSAGVIIEVGLQSKTTASGHVALPGAAPKERHSAGRGREVRLSSRGGDAAPGGRRPGQVGRSAQVAQRGRRAALGPDHHDRDRREAERDHDDRRLLQGHAAGSLDAGANETPRRTG